MSGTEELAYRRAVRQRVAHNFTWLGLGEGSTRAVRVIGNIALARFLGAAGLGVLSLAQTSAGYAASFTDLGVSFCAQAEAAKSTPDGLTELAQEIIPVRAVLGLTIFAIFTLGATLLLPAPLWRLSFALAGISILSEALRSDWLFRGRERFDLVTLARVAECLFWLAWVMAVGARSGAVMLDALGWALAGGASAVIWLGLLPRLLGGGFQFRLQFGKWFGHVRESIFVSISQLANSAAWLGLLWLVASAKGKGEVGVLTAPYGLIASAVNLGTLLVMAAYPISAALYRNSARAFIENRRDLSRVLLGGGVAVAVIGCILARPLVLLVFGRGYRASIPVLAALVWFVPIRLMRVLYGTSLVASSFPRLHPIGALVGAVVTAILAYPTVHAWGATGAAIALVTAEIGNVSATFWMVRLAHGDGIRVCRER